MQQQSSKLDRVAWYLFSLIDDRQNEGIMQGALLWAFLLGTIALLFVVKFMG